MENGLKYRILKLARRVLENELFQSEHDLSEFDETELQEKRGLFVTLHLNGQLRGCIGRLEAHNSIFKNVIDLSKAAAFEDHRFKNLTAKELNKVKIEVSILTKPVELEGKTTFDKVMQIRPDKDGVIIDSGRHSATFLPQVWESVPVRENFISDLCRKAGLTPDYWMHNHLDISVYQVEYFEED